MNFLKSSLAILCIIFFLSNDSVCSTVVLIPNYDQDSTKSYLPIAGNRSISLGINPLFSYVGNMFNGSSGNTLDISSGSIVYRKFKENNVARRYRLNLGIASQSTLLSGSTNSYPYGLDNGSRRTNDLSITFAFGKEKRYDYGRFALYTGWEFITGINHNNSKFYYDKNDGDTFDNTLPFVLGYERQKSTSQFTSLDLGIAGILGAEYYLSKRFFVGCEFSLPFFISVRRYKDSIYERINIDSQTSKVRVIEDEGQDPSYLISGSFRSNNLIQFRAGIIF